MLPTLDLAFDGSAEPHEARIRLTAGQRPIGTIFFRCETAPLAANAGALLCLGLIPAMEVHAPLRVAGPVDPALLASAAAIQDLLRSWYPAYRTVPVTADAADRAYPAGRGSALFYSGGIDSSHSLAQEKDRLDALVTIVDASAPGRPGPAGERLVAALSRAAAAYGLEPVVIETNVRAVMQPYLGWIEFHGSAMAAIRHLLADRFETMLIASSGDETSWSTPWGSHPALDPLLGTPGARIEHHGLVKRLDKIRSILTQPVLMEHLHICNSDPRVNCGRCTKCHFAMACLEVLDAVDDAPGFPRHPRDAPYRFHVADDATRSEYVHLRAAASATGRCGGLVADVDRALATYDGARRWRSGLDTGALGQRLKRAKHRARYWRASR